MSEDVYAAVNGHRVTRVHLTVSNGGPWIADVDFDAAPELSGRVELTIETLKLSGTITAQSGTFGERLRARIVAGAGGWSKVLDAKGYHNDAGVKARLIADDAARAAGETIGTFVPARERLGRDYARQVGPASCTLEDAVGREVAWWVDYDGVTHAGPRPATTLDADAYDLLAYDPRDRIATLAVDEPGNVKVGSTLKDERLDGDLVVRSFELRLTSSELRVFAWCGGVENGLGRAASALRAIVTRAVDGKLHGHYRYRVIRMAGERVELQAVRKLVGLPDLLPLSAFPGIPGAHAVLTPGTEVLVAFIEGDRSQPVVVAYAGVDGPGFVPVSLTLGGSSGAPAARQGDVVEVQLPPAQFSGTWNGSPASGIMTFTPAKALGLITSGSSKVRISS